MHMNISYIDMCKLKKNREWRKELKKERERLVVMVCVVVHLVNHLKQETFQTSLYIQTNGVGVNIINFIK